MFFGICSTFAKLDVLSLEDWYSNNFNFKETGPFSPNFELIGSDNTIHMTNSGSYYGVQSFIVARVLICLIIVALVGKCSKYKMAR